MFPKIMNDENFFKKAAAHGEEPPLTPQNEHQRSGLRFARRVRLPRAVGLAGMFLPIASTLVSHPPPGWWWLVLVGWAFVWPHLAWQIASRAVDPLSREIYNLKTDAVLAGMWVGVMGVNVLPSTAMLMIMCLNLMGAGGPRLFVAGLVLMVVSCLVTLELTGITVSFNSAPLEWWLSLPIIVIYPLLFGWVSYQTATKLAEHKRRLQVMSTRDGMTGVYNRRHVLNITVESPVKFSEVVYHICRQAGGEEGEFILSDIEKELSMEKRTVVVNNPLTVNCEEKRILSQLYKNLSEKILEDHFEEFATVNQKVIQFMDKVTSSSEYNLTYDVDFQAAGLIKYCNVHMDSCYDSLTEKFINYLRTMKQICNVDIVFVLNLKQYFSTEDLREIYKHCFYTKMYLINLEGVKSDPIESDRYVIIDKDLCVLDLVY